MKVEYRGFELSVVREESMGGWDNLYYYAMRKSDGYFAFDAFSEGSETVREFMKYLKEMVDDFISNPKEYE